jgi:hypothetical protein
MSTVNGIKGNGKVLFEGPRNPATHLQMVRLLGLRATPAARERLQAYIQTGKKPARLITLFERTCASLHLELGKFTEQAFVERFANWRIEGLDKDVNLNSPDYQIRFLLERVFNCGLAYHNESGLAMVSSEERDDIAKGDAEGYQLACPFAAKPQIIAPPISAPLPRITLTRRVVALVKHLAQPLAEKRSYSEQLRQRILFHVTEGHFRSAAFLLFRDKTAREILDFVRKENLAERISSPEWTILLRIGIRPDIDYSAPSEEIAIGFLLAEAHPVISAYFIEDLAKSDPHSAARILGLVGQATRSVEVAEVGDLTSDVERSLAGYVLSAMLIRGQEKPANRAVASGLLDPVFRETYIRVLNELHSDFDESIVTMDRYHGNSLFEEGTAGFRQAENKGGTAIIKVKPGPYGWGGEELLSPRLFYRNLARKLIEGEGYDLAWEMMTCGRPAVEAFNDLNSVLDPASFGRLLVTRGRDEIARFVVEVVAGGEQNVEALAYVLRDTHEDIRDVAGLFEYLIEADGEIAGSREAAYAILYYASTAIENPSMAPLLDRYQEILVQIEQDKENAGWFNADVFLKEGRFLPTDPPSKAREDRIKFYFDLLRNAARPEEERIYAVRMMGRMGAIEYLDPLRKIITVELKARSYNKLLMNTAKSYLDIGEGLDMKNPDHRAAQRRAARFLKGTRDRLAALFSSDIETGYQVLVEGDRVDRSEQLKKLNLERAKEGRKQEAVLLLEIALNIATGIKHDLRSPPYPEKIARLKYVQNQQRRAEAEKASLIAYVAAAMEQVDMPKDTVAKVFKEALNKIDLKVRGWFPSDSVDRAISANRERISQSLARAGFYDEAFTVATVYPAFTNVIIEMAQRGDFERAVNSTKEIRDEKLKSNILSQIGHIVTQAKISKEQAADIIQQILSIAREIKDGWMRASALKEIAVVMAKIDMPKNLVVDIFREATIEIAGAVYSREKEWFISQGLIKIAEAMVLADVPKDIIIDKLGWALSIGMKLTSISQKLEVLCRVARIGSQVGLPKERIIDIFEEAAAQSGFPTVLFNDGAYTNAEREGVPKDKIDEAWEKANTSKGNTSIVTAMRQVGIPKDKIFDVFKPAFIKYAQSRDLGSNYTSYMVKHINQLILMIKRGESNKIKHREIINLLISVKRAGISIETILGILERAASEAGKRENMHGFNWERFVAVALVQAGYIGWAIRAAKAIYRDSSINTLADLAVIIYKDVDLEAEGLPKEQKVAAQLHAHIYAILGMAEE